jgi:hypothetical protein
LLPGSQRAAVRSTRTRARLASTGAALTPRVILRPYARDIRTSATTPAIATHHGPTVEPRYLVANHHRLGRERRPSALLDNHAAALCC